MPRIHQQAIEETELRIDESITVPCRIILERRSSIRSSIGKKEAILRMPVTLPREVREQRVRWFFDWVKKQFVKNRHLGERFREKVYRSGDRLVVGSRTYVLQISREERKSHSAKLKNGVIELRLRMAIEGPELGRAIGQLLSRVIAKDFLPEVTTRVRELNNRYFQKTIQGVRLKYNHSNWGSCSNKGIINLSTRLLFAPQPVMDYVIIHELAHLIEFNHSPLFWQIVREIMPDFEEKQQWLKEHGGKCYF